MIAEVPDQVHFSNLAQALGQNAALQIEKRVEMINVKYVVCIEHRNGLGVDAPTCLQKRKQVCRLGGRVSARVVIVSWRRTKR